MVWLRLSDLFLASSLGARYAVRHRRTPTPADRKPPYASSLYVETNCPKSSAAWTHGCEKGSGTHLQGFVSEREDGALIGPFPPVLHFPEFGAPVWDLVAALTRHSTLPKPAHEVVMLVTGARFRSCYELYAHEHVAMGAGLPAAKVATIVAGERPSDLTADEAIAYDVASALSGGAQLPEATYRAAKQAFGEKGTAELVYLIGAYCLVSVMLNAYDVSVPGRG